MEKIAVAVLGVAAFVVAAYLVLARRQLSADAPRSRLGARFALLVSTFVALLGGARPAGGGPSGRGGKAPAAKQELSARTEWVQIRASWHGVPKLKQPGYDALQKVIADKRAECNKLLDKLVRAKLVERTAADVLVAIYADRIYHYLRQTAATCYDPTELGARVMTTRSSLDKRLTLLQKHRGKLKPAVAAKLERALKKEMELVLRVNALWEKQKDGNWAAHRKEEQQILALFAKRSSYSSVEIKDSIQIRPGVEGAMRLVRLLYQ
jgi:hypothetical protein